MKRVLAILLVLGLCCGLFGCGGGGGGTSKSSKLEGEWVSVGFASYYGGTTIYDMDSMTLQTGGKLIYGSEEGSWKYDAAKKQIIAELRGIEIPIQVEEQDGQTVLRDSYGGIFFRPGTECALCKEVCPGTWNELTSEPDRQTMELNSDGSMTVNSETHTWKSVCSPEAHYLDISDYGLVKVDPNAAAVSAFDRVYYKDNQYTFIEITPDNWTEYFTADFMTNFELQYDVKDTVTGDEWEQKTIQEVSVYAALTDRENFAYHEDKDFFYIADNLILEYSYEVGTQTFTVDGSGAVVPGEVKQEYYDRYQNTTNFYTRSLGGDTPLSFSLYLGGGDISQPVSVKIPKKVLRMKGWLIVKDKSKLTKPVEPAPVVGSYAGDICPGADLPVFGADTTVDPTKTGKATILSFWASYHSAEADYLAMFDQMTARYGDSLSVFAVHDFPDDTFVPDPLLNGYENDRVIFLWDKDGAYYKGLHSQPMILVLDKTGRIVEVLQYGTELDALTKAVETAMN